MAKSPEERLHQEWLGYVQPVGLVVSTPALVAAQCNVQKNIGREHQRFLGIMPNADDELVPQIDSFRTFATEVLGWRDSDLCDVSVDALPSEFDGLEVVLPEYNESLRPTFVVPAFEPEEGQKPWMILVKQVTPGHPLDEVEETDNRRWQASPHAKFERLLRETEVPIGILTNGEAIRLVYAPRGETSGYMTFDVAQMATVAGRPIFGAMHMLLCEERLFALDKDQLLPAILVSSRKYQNTVSTKLAEQVMAALFELLRGFQAADDQRKGDLLRDVLKNNPQHVYHGSLTVLMRMVFILYAEDRGLISTDPVYTNYYSVSGLFERLRSDAGRFPDTMDQRFGAWAQLLTLFRLVYEGGQHDAIQIPARKGYLFDPDRYPFLEGRFDDGDVNLVSEEEANSEIQVPRVSDGVIYRVLEDLLVLDGERLSYRTLDVEQIGSVYEAIMGFELEVAKGRSIAIKPIKSHGAPATINLEALLEAKPSNRIKLLGEWTDQKLGTAGAKALKDAATIEDLLAALDKKIAKHVTRNTVPKGAMIFQPSDERRRSGSHYTPRSLTEPIVRTTLEPILKRLSDSDSDLPSVWEPTSADEKRYTKGEIAERIRISKRDVEAAKLAREIGVPHPRQLLDLKICDPAMGSGAFLVETCRQLGDELIKSWYAHDMIPSDIPADEDEVLFARRLVAQRCLYGVDKNVMAVDLAKLSLWLVTLAKDHAFTFLDHSLRHGDSLVGLSREQIIGFHWDVKKQKKFGEDQIQKRLDRATEARAKILNAREDVPYKDQEQRLAVADEALDLIRLLGDACVSCFFAQSKKNARDNEATRVYALANSYFESQKHQQIDIASRTGLQKAAARLRDCSQGYPVPTFHWEIEFPEVFSRKDGGFDAFVGNPPFLGGQLISGSHGDEYLAFIKTMLPPAPHYCDLVAYFFQQSFNLLRTTGCFGLIATKSIAIGDTKNGSLLPIIKKGGTIYNCTTRLPWPGQAAVIISVIHVCRSSPHGEIHLDGIACERISAFLKRSGPDEDPVKLSTNRVVQAEGTKIYGRGFVFDDKDDQANPLSLRDELLTKCPDLEPRLPPYIGGDEVVSSPTHDYYRYVINVTDVPTEEELKTRFPQLEPIIREMVKPGRDKLRDTGSSKPLKKRWWKYQAHRPAFYQASEGLNRVIGICKVSAHLSFAFIPTGMIYSSKLVVFASDDDWFFCLLQSRCHESWTQAFGGIRGDGYYYTPSDCYDTFPHPSQEDSLVAAMNEAGKTYYDFRAQLLVTENLGLTDLYNRFHSPDERDEGILELRRLHDQMDSAVLRAYGWDDLADQAPKPDFCQFLLDYEEEDDDEPGSKKSKKKKPWRYRWPDEFRDEVLARLLELNEQRHKEELKSGVVAAAQEKKRANKSPNKTTPKPGEPTQPELF